MTNRRTFLKSIVAAGIAGPSAPALAARTQKLRAIEFSTGTSYKGYHFGWIRGYPSLKNRAEMFSAPLDIKKALPARVDLRPDMPPVYDQLQIGSCVANSAAAMIQFARRKHRQTPDFVPSRAFIYYNGRAFESTIASDAGMMIEDAVKVAVNLGVCSEADWPYDGAPLCDNDDPVTGCVKGQWRADSRNAARPQKKIYDRAFQYRTVAGRPVPQRLDEMKGCLAEGYPFIFGFTIYETFFQTPTSIPPATAPRKVIPMPTLMELPVGQHAVVAVGYDDGQQTFVCRNSWGTVDRVTGMEMQDKGHFYMPYDYLLNEDLASDFYTVRATAAFQ